jgi:hypothetical protein
MSEYLELTPRLRVAIVPDLDPRDVRVSGESITGTYTPPNLWGHPAQGPLPLYDFPGDIVDADVRLFDNTSWDAERGIQRWAWLAYGLELQRHGGTYWYCDRTMFDHLHGGDFTREAQADVIRSERLEYQRWCDGEARFLSLQRRASFRRVTKKYHDHLPELMYVWEDIESVGDIYFDDSWTPVDVTHEYFYDLLRPSERAVLQAMLDEQRAL